MSLRVIAVSAPEYPEGRVGSKTLNSRDPASLYNACRYAAFLAESGLGAWGDSNWCGSRLDRRGKMLLMHSLKEELSCFEQLLARERPNLLLIGAMSLCMPGAIECAKVAKQMFGDEICVILGGRHVNETIFLEKRGRVVSHHNGSPLKLMAEGAIDRAFDVVVSGEGEFVIAKLGELVSNLSDKGESLPCLLSLRGDELAETPGVWIAGSVNGDQITTITSSGKRIDRDKLPSPAMMFGVATSFDIFGGRLTGHAFSDTGPGCVYNCTFCSEASSVCGGIVQAETSASRLFRQLVDIDDVIRQDSPGCKSSAFVEDSIILAGLPSQLQYLLELLRSRSLDIRFGGQLTIDLALKRMNLLTEMYAVGMDYLFLGLETLRPDKIGGMSKDTRKSGWLERAETLVVELSDRRIRVGFSLLHGLGEKQQDRLELMEVLKSWRTKYGAPQVLSFNWAVQHPLRGQDGDCGYDYTQWGDEEYLRAFRDYGEASNRYPLAGVVLPTLRELEELAIARQQL